MFNIKQEGRILYISSVDISLNGGAGVNEREFTFELCKVFGEQAHILIPEPEHPLKEINDCNLTFYKGHQHYKPFPFLQHQISQLQQAERLIKFGGTNFLIFRADIFPLGLIYITRRYKIPYAIKTLGVGMVNALEQRGGVVGKMSTPFNEKLVKDLTSRAIAIDVCTKAYLSFFTERLSLDPDKLRWIDNATNTNRFSPIDQKTAKSACGLTAFEPIIGYVGGIAWMKGGAQMIEIAPKLLSQYPNLGIVIVGGGNGIDRLQKRALELGVAEHCIFPGLIPYEQIPNFINAFDIGISINTKEFVAHIGNSSQKIRQYVACGKPVVSGPGGNIFLEEEGLGAIVSPDDIDQIASTVNKWLSLANHEKETHCRRAVNYAQKHLSMNKTLNDRLEFWNERLQLVG